MNNLFNIYSSIYFI